jgi:PAS domain S-box-containing protein
MLDIDGSPEYFDGIIEDITERRQAKRDLEKSAANLRAIIENTLESIWSVNTRYEIQYVNEVFATAFQNTFGVHLSKGSNIVESLPEFLQPVWKERYDRTFKNEHYVFEDKIELGEICIYIEVAMNPILVDGEVVGASIYGKDITQQKMVEEGLIKAKEKAEESDRLKSAFLANMSHEIRTPMNGILGFLELLREPDLSEENKNNYLNIVSKSGERLLDTINDIIEVSKIEAGEMQVHISSVNIHELMAYYHGFFKQMTDRKGLRFEVSNQLPAEFSTFGTDRNKLESIITNLLKNAIKFTSSGSIEFGNHTSGGELLFYVRDTGIGIHADRVDSIFGRFIQADQSNTRPHEGSGLGLSIAKAYTDMLGGNIWVESEIGKGSTFYFSLPAKIRK